MTMSKVPKQSMDRRIALLAWEGTCERLHNAFKHNPAVPELTSEELRQTIVQARNLLSTLELLHCKEP
jgi:hypothetical protein